VCAGWVSGPTTKRTKGRTVRGMRRLGVTAAREHGGVGVDGIESREWCISLCSCTLRKWAAKGTCPRAALRRLRIRASLIPRLRVASIRTDYKSVLPARPRQTPRRAWPAASGRRAAAA
jgi:hypothetical protein